MKPTVPHSILQQHHHFVGRRSTLPAAALAGNTLAAEAGHSTRRAVVPVEATGHPDLADTSPAAAVAVAVDNSRYCLQDNHASRHRWADSKGRHRGALGQGTSGADPAEADICFGRRP